MKIFFLFLALVLSAPFLLAQEYLYFTEHYDASAPLEARYAYLINKRQTAEGWYNEKIYEHKAECRDLEAKKRLLIDLSDEIGRIKFRGYEKHREELVSLIEMMSALYRDVYLEYKTSEEEAELNRRLLAETRKYIATKDERDRVVYAKTMFELRRGEFIWQSIIPDGTDKYFVEGLCAAYGDEPDKMIEIYNASRLDIFCSLSEYLNRQKPRNKKLIERTSAAEKMRKQRSIAKPVSTFSPFQPLPQKTPSTEMLCGNNFVSWLARTVATLAVGGIFLWVWRRRKRSRA